MADVSIPRDAVEAAARALAESDTPPQKWDDLQPSAQYRWAVRAKAALTAAAPLIVAAELDRIAKAFRAEYDELTEDVDVVRDPAALELYEKAKKFRARATELRAQP
ncbi:hypothetical protein [Lentzea sp. NPDC092896]|uniref:hypothetical protein n=1 Tax=Lentzea sp. NPDC092896 TaxID=3364127 RepID=UPI00381C668B